MIHSTGPACAVLYGANPDICGLYAVLTASGLGCSDISRLGRHWDLVLSPHFLLTDTSIRTASGYAGIHY